MPPVSVTERKKNLGIEENIALPINWLLQPTEETLHGRAQ